jgi:hypothetical protein
LMRRLEPARHVAGIHRGSIRAAWG